MIVEDEATVALDLQYTLENLGFEVVSVEASGEDAVKTATKELPDIVLMDIHLRDDMDGIEAADLIYSQNEIPVVFLTAFSDDSMLDRAKNVGSLGYLIKPCQERELYVTLEMALYKADLDKKNKALELQLRHTQKLEGFSVMAGSVAHNFNNILQITQGYTSLAQNSVASDSNTYSYLQKVDDSIKRAVEINKLMLHYVGQAPDNPVNLNISDFLKNHKKHLHSFLGENISFTLKLRDSGCKVNIEEQQIQLLVFNLFMNAIEAIDDKEGSIVISTATEFLDVDKMIGTYIQENLPSGHYIIMEISDSGCGIDKSLEEKIFDPFFTTKFVGRGLGLAAVLGIVHNLHGAIEYKSKVDEGTVFKIYLPC